MRRFWHGCAISLIILNLSGCGDSDNYAPVTEVNTIDPIPRAGVHRAARRESIYEIAWRYGLDYRQLVARNHLKSPYMVRQGQLIYLGGISHPTIAPLSTKPSSSLTEPTPVFIKREAPAPLAPAPTLAEKEEPNLKVSTWIWPAKGRIVSGYSGFNKGINISGHLGAPIYAAASGKVVYCGSGLRGYGNLIILKHNQTYLSAYAYNRQLFVKEGQWVKQGQKIADMGENIGSGKAMLHFEIRRAGKPIDPLTLHLGS